LERNNRQKRIKDNIIEPRSIAGFTFKLRRREQNEKHYYLCSRQPYTDNMIGRKKQLT